MLLDKQVGSIREVDPRLILILTHVDERLKSYGFRGITLTSVFRDGDPGYHGKGLAADIRCTDWKYTGVHDLVINILVDELSHFGVDIVHETPEINGKPEHLHIEVDLRKLK